MQGSAHNSRRLRSIYPSNLILRRSLNETVLAPNFFSSISYCLRRSVDKDGNKGTTDTSQYAAQQNEFLFQEVAGALSRDQNSLYWIIHAQSLAPISRSRTVLKTQVLPRKEDSIHIDFVVSRILGHSKFSYKPIFQKRPLQRCGLFSRSLFSAACFSAVFLQTQILETVMWDHTKLPTVLMLFREISGVHL